MNLQIRRAVHADAEKIAGIHKAAVNGLRGNIYRDDELDSWLAAFIPHEVYEAIEDLSTILEVVENNRIIVSFGFVKNEELIALYVLPPFQNQGIGRKLLKHLEDYSKKRSVCFLKSRISLSSRDFYLKQGYYILDQQIYHGIRHYNAQKWLDDEFGVLKEECK